MTNQKDQRNILLIDGLNSLFQLNHNNTPLKDLLWTFVTDLKRIMGELHINRAVLVYDKGESRYRMKLHPGYKGERKARRAKEALDDPAKAAADARFRDAAFRVIGQLPAFGIETLCFPNVEADDVIAYMVNHLDTDLYQVYIMSTDTDLLQLLRPGVQQRGYCKTMGLKPTDVKIPDKVWVNVKRFTDAYGFAPHQYTHMKALAGDRGDSVPSPPGLGEGWALKLIQTYGSLDGVRANLDDLRIPRMPAKVKEALKSNWGLVEQAYELVNLRHTPEQEQAIFTAQEVATVTEAMERFAEAPKLQDDLLKEMLLEAGKVGVFKAYEVWRLPLSGQTATCAW